MKTHPICKIGLIAATISYSITAVDGQGPARRGPVIAEIEVDELHTAHDFIKKIKAALPEDQQSALIIDVPERELAEMPVRSLRLCNVDLGLVLRYMEEIAPLGGKYVDGAWHIQKKDREDLIAGEYQFTIAEIKALGLVLGNNETLELKNGGIWPPESPWSATYRILPPSKHDPPELRPEGDGRSVAIRVMAPRYYQEELAALQLLYDRGYTGFSLKR